MKTQLKLQRALDVASRAVDTLDFGDPDLYPAWLSQAYYFVRHSTPLLALSCGLSVENRAYHTRCIAHLSEEKGHDKMLLNDLKQMGRKVEEYEELGSTQAFYQTQYYWIEHRAPESFLGYVFILEGLAVQCGQAKVDQIVDPKSGTFMRLHTEEDVGHLDSLYEMIAQMSPEHQDLIVKNAELSAQLYTNMAAELNYRYGAKKKVSGL